MTFLLKQVRVPRAKVNFTSEINQTHGNQTFIWTSHIDHARFGSAHVKFGLEWTVTFDK